MAERRSRVYGAVVVGLLCAPSFVMSAGPKIVVPRGATTNAVEITGIPVPQLARLKNADLSKVLLVGVAPKTANADPAPMLGEQTLAKGRLRFVPEFPFRRGVKYRVVFDPAAPFSRRTGAGGNGGRVLRRDFLIPRPKPKRDAVITQVYPTAKVLPENLLKFYIHFSVPMSRGEAYRRISLVDAATGKVVDRPFLEVGEELWDPAGTRFTLYIEPGRIKRGLKPREDLGPALVQGKSYRLVVNAKWRTADGRTLKSGFSRPFRVGPPDEIQPDHKRWNVAAPNAGTKQPLVVTFGEALDQAMLMRVLRVQNATGRDVAGRIAVEKNERRWSFTPVKPWESGRHTIRVDTTLEDLAGNSIGQPFEVRITKRTKERPSKPFVYVRFNVRTR